MSTFSYLRDFVVIATAISLTIIIFLVFIVIPLALLYGRIRVNRVRSKRTDDRFRVAFFHPYCNSGGGGERVLWCAVRALLDAYPRSKVVVYTTDVDAAPDVIKRKVRERFGIEVPHSVKFIYLSRKSSIDPEQYPRFTLLMQFIGSFMLGLEALNAYVPDVFIDTMGFSSTLPLFKLVGNCKVAAYVHYPTITSDMCKVVRDRRHAHNNDERISRNPFLTAGKLLYYHLLTFVYKFHGCFPDVIMVNSSWTEAHILSLWKRPLATHKVFPPCDVADLQRIPDERPDDKLRILSVAQFRREKNHPLQLQAMFALRQIVPAEVWENVELVIVGSTRGPDDERWAQDIRDYAKHLSVEDNVRFVVNATYEQLKEEYAKATIGLHTMWNEHFGISVVESMAAGLITVAHNSGGPMMDIVVEEETSRNGFLATTASEYARSFAIVTLMSPNARERVRNAARASVERFSVDEFGHNFVRAVEPLMR